MDERRPNAFGRAPTRSGTTTASWRRRTKCSASRAQGRHWRRSPARPAVAIGTLYGHFPNRRALCAALLRERHTALFEFGDQLPRQGSALDALAKWMRAVTAHAAAYRGLATLLMESLDDEASELHEACGRMAAITEALLHAAREAGAVRDDVTAADVHALMNAAAWMREQVQEDMADHLLDLMVNGLRPGHEPVKR